VSAPPPPGGGAPPPHDREGLVRIKSTTSNAQNTSRALSGCRRNVGEIAASDGTQGTSYPRRDFSSEYGRPFFFAE
jgi:hypothetical protein